MKLLTVLVLTSLTSVHASDLECSNSAKKVDLAATFQVCRNQNDYTALPKTKFYSEKIESITAQKIAYVKGYITAFNRNTATLKEFTKLTGATIRLDIADLPKENLVKESALLNLNSADVADFGEDLQYGQFPLKNARITSVLTPSYTMMGPEFYNQYILPEQKIDSILAEPMVCKIITGKVEALETCQIIYDEHRPECNCSYIINK